MTRWCAGSKLPHLSIFGLGLLFDAQTNIFLANNDLVDQFSRNFVLMDQNFCQLDQNFCDKPYFTVEKGIN